MLKRIFTLFFTLIGIWFFTILTISLWVNPYLTIIKMKEFVWIPVWLWYKKISISTFDSEFKKYWFNKDIINEMKNDKKLRVVANEVNDEFVSWNYNNVLNIMTLFWVKNWKIDDIDTLFHETIHYLLFNNKKLLETFREEISKFKVKYEKELLDDNFKYNSLELLKSWNYQKLAEFSVIETIWILHWDYSPKGKNYSIENIDKGEMKFAQEIIAFKVINWRTDICRVFPKTANLIYNDCNEKIQNQEKK